MKWHKFSNKCLLHEHISEFAWFLCECSVKKLLDLHQDTNLLLDNETKRQDSGAPIGNNGGGVDDGGGAFPPASFCKRKRIVK